VIDPSIQAQIVDFLLLLLKDIGSYNKLKAEGMAKEQLKNIKPQVLQDVTLGFNSTVQKLESQVRGKKAVDDPILYVFVCRLDISPPLLIQHFPNLCYMAGSETQQVKLIQLPRGTVDKLESVTGEKLRIIGLKHSSAVSKGFIELLNDDTKVPGLDIEWLRDIKFHKAKVNMVKTTAPIINKASKNKVSKVKKVDKK
jgi:ribonuclease P/MRP protein subunit POP3